MDSKVIVIIVMLLQHVLFKFSFFINFFSLYLCIFLWRKVLKFQ